MKRPNKGPTGTEALSAIGAGLGQLFDGLKDVIEQAETSSDGTHRVHRSGGENGRPEVVTSFTSGSVDEFLKARGKATGDGEDVAANAQYTPDYKSAEAGIATPDAAEFESPAGWEVIEDNSHYLFVCDLSGKDQSAFEVVVEDQRLVARFGAAREEIAISLPEDAVADQPFHRIRNGIAEVRLDRMAASTKSQTEGADA